MAAFTVDTKLFQELGALLVAKEATALVELVKNAYDADATLVTVHGENLRDANKGSITVTDDGLGMSAQDFQNGFLRIAGRTKVTADRKSPVFTRRYTGEKGVGRLATHKLARKLRVLSRRAGPTDRGADELSPALTAIRASIDWDKIEALETLDQVERSDAVELQKLLVRRGRQIPSGTHLKLAPLRRAWTTRMVEAFLKEAVTLVPTEVLWDKLPDGVAIEPLLFEQAPIRDQASSDPGFRVQFSGDLAVPDVITPDAAHAASWIAEIEFERESGILEIAVTPTPTGLRSAPSARGFRFKKDLGRHAGPSFRARILQMSGKVWDPAVQGVRVFMEGFRVPPYGDSSDDWLGLDQDYKSRAGRKLTTLENLDVKSLPGGVTDEELGVQASAAYMGAVFLHRGSSPELEMLVNREGFLPGPGLDFVADWVKVSTDLIVRLGFAGRRKRREDEATRQSGRAEQSKAAAKADVTETPAAFRVRESAAQVRQQLDVVQSALQKGDMKTAVLAAEAARPSLDDVRDLSTEFGGEAMRWRVLASLGTELAAFVHEVRSLALETGGIVADLDGALPHIVHPGAARRVRQARQSVMTLADRIRRNAAYLVDATSFQGRRRRSRLPLRERVEAVVPFFESRLAQREITFSNEISTDLRTPPMFPAELTGIFTNLLSNAVKFTNNGGRIAVSAELVEGMLVVKIENTGSAVNLARAGELFEAFESTTERPDAVLGQGMGMGLTITRAFIHEYGGDIRFVAPSQGFATAIRFEIPSR